MKFERILTGRKFGSQVRNKLFIADHDLFDQYFRSYGVYRYFAWIDEDAAFDCAKPEFAVFVFEACRKAEITFRALHPIGGTISYRMYRLDFTVSKIIHLFSADAENTFVAAHPEIATIILEQRINAVIEQPVLPATGDEFAVRKSVQSPLGRPNPYHAVAVLIEGHYRVVR